MKYDICVVHIPYDGPPTPRSVREWYATSNTPVLVYRPHTLLGDSFEPQYPRGSGTTREDAIANLISLIEENARILAHHKVTVERLEIDVPSPSAKRTRKTTVRLY